MRVALLMALLLSACGEGLEFREGRYLLEVDCYENNLGKPYKITVPVDLGKHKGVWGMIGMGGVVKKGALHLSIPEPCIDGAHSYITAELTPTKAGFEGTGKTIHCGDVSIVLQRKRLTGVFIE